MNINELIVIIEQESKDCRETAAKSGEYGTAFWVCGTMLHSLANRLRCVRDDRALEEQAKGLT